MRLVEGQLVHGRYRLDRRLAQGGMGEVWQGYDIQLHRDVAVKALRADIKDSVAKLRRLRMEARNSADLAHPNIAALFEYYEHDGIGFIVMEYVPSDSLADWFRAKGAMDPTELLPILIQTSRGLFVAHSHGVIHRDVKPANIMVSDDGEVKITDFGVSTSTNQAQITQDGMVVGTAQYISPEQAQGKQATPQSDIYSLGVVAYEGLCGHRPFTGATPVEIAAAHVNDKVPPLPETVDLQLRQFVMSMLEKDPLDRPKDALVVSHTLARIERRLLDQRTEAEDTLIVPRSGRLPRRISSAAGAKPKRFGHRSDGQTAASLTPPPAQRPGGVALPLSAVAPVVPTSGAHTVQNVPTASTELRVMSTELVRSVSAQSQHFSVHRGQPAQHAQPPSVPPDPDPPDPQPMPPSQPPRTEHPLMEDSVDEHPHAEHPLADGTTHEPSEFWKEQL